MSFSDLQFGKDTGSGHIFVNHAEVKQYLEKYAEPARDYYSFNTTVERVELIESTGQYKLVLRKAVDESTDYWWTDTFDGVIVATGQFSVPLIPDSIEGLTEFWNSPPSSPSSQGGNTGEEVTPRCLHAKYFKNNLPFKDKTVIVVGAGVSGCDIVDRVLKVAKKVYHSKRTPNRWESLPGYVKRDGVVIKPEIRKIEAVVTNSPETDDKDSTTTTTTTAYKVIFNDDSAISDIDHIVFATGYQHDYPFLRELTSKVRHVGSEEADQGQDETIKKAEDASSSGNTTTNPTSTGIVTKGRVADIYMDTFSIRFPNLAFPASVRAGSWASFRNYEFQAYAVDGVFSGRSTLPSVSEMRRLTEEYLAKEKELEKAPFKGIDLVQTMAAEFGKLAGVSNSGKALMPTWTSEQSQVLSDSAIEYMVECAYLGNKPDPEAMKNLTDMLGITVPGTKERSN